MTEQTSITRSAEPADQSLSQPRSNDSPVNGADSGPAKPSRAMGPLWMLIRAAWNYPGHMAGAGLALLTTSAATLAIPSGFKLVIDRGFGEGEITRWFQYLLILVLVLAIGTAFRFYLVSWLSERVVADLRLKVYDNLVTLPPSFYEDNNPREISSRMTADTAIIEQVVGSTISVA